MSQFQSRKLGHSRNQAAVPKRPISFDAGRAQGLLLRGVVTKTYVIDNPDHPYANGTPIAVYCDVLVYSSVKGTTFRLLPNCLVSQDRGAMHSGRVWKPKAATIDISGDTFDLEKGTDPSSVDGDHVLVGFLDDSFNLPVVLKGLSHPAVDVGNEERDAGNRLQLLDTDGDPDFWKHHGTYYGVDDNGDFIVDTTFANDGKIGNDGKEADPPTDGKGTQRYRLEQNAEHEVVLYDMGDPSSPNEVARVVVNKDSFEVHFEQGDSIKIEGKDGDAKLTLGDGAVSVAIADAFETFWTTVKTNLDIWGSTHIHPSGMGPTGPPSPTYSLDAWDSAIKSTKVKIPDG
jgi:hypothetical protein